MERHASNTTAAVIELKDKTISLREVKRRKGDQNNPVFNAVVISDLENRVGESLVPLNAMEQILNRLHPCHSFQIMRLQTVLAVKH
jgi:hypothetical protein